MSNTVQYCAGLHHTLSTLTPSHSFTLQPSASSNTLQASNQQSSTHIIAPSATIPPRPSVPHRLSANPLIVPIVDPAGLADSPSQDLNGLPSLSDLPPAPSTTTAASTILDLPLSTSATESAPTIDSERISPYTGTADPPRHVHGSVAATAAVDVAATPAASASMAARSAFSDSITAAAAAAAVGAQQGVTAPVHLGSKPVLVVQGKGDGEFHNQSALELSQLLLQQQQDVQKMLPAVCTQSGSMQQGGGSGFGQVAGEWEV